MSVYGRNCNDIQILRRYGLISSKDKSKVSSLHKSIEKDSHIAVKPALGNQTTEWRPMKSREIRSYLALTNN